MDELLTTDEAAQVAGVSTTTIYGWMRRGLLRPLFANKGQYIFTTHALQEADQASKIMKNNNRRPGSNARRSASAKRIWQQRKAAQD